jgi:hypothetical protein
MNEKARAGVYVLAGIYLLYMAYQVFGARMDSTGMEQTLMLVFSVIFLLCGIGLFAFAAYMMKKK